ncbi:MAG: hypothetical protein WDO15_04430 [Bacteroidota bacterium]
MRLSNRDIILLIGIVVAIVITLTTVVYRDHMEAARKEIITPKKTSMAMVVVRKLVDFIGTNSSVTHSR